MLKSTMSPWMLVLIAGCGADAGAPPQSPAAPEMASPSETATNATDQAPAEASKGDATGAVAEGDATKSVYLIGGASVSDVEPDVLIAALKTLGYNASAGVDTSRGRWEQRIFHLKKGGKQAGMIQLVRRAKTAKDDGGDDAVASPAATVERQKQGGIGEVFYDAAAEVAVIVVIAGPTPKSPEAKTLLDGLVTRSK